MPENSICMSLFFDTNGNAIYMSPVTSISGLTFKHETSADVYSIHIHCICSQILFKSFQLLVWNKIMKFEFNLKDDLQMHVYF